MHSPQMLRVSVLVAFLASRCPFVGPRIRLHVYMVYSAMPSPTHYPYLRHSSTSRVCHVLSRSSFPPSCRFVHLIHLQCLLFQSSITSKITFILLAGVGFLFRWARPSSLEGLLFGWRERIFSFAIPACSRRFWLLQLESWLHCQCRYVSSLAAPRAPTSQSSLFMVY